MFRKKSSNGKFNIAWNRYFCEKINFKYFSQKIYLIQQQYGVVPLGICWVRLKWVYGDGQAGLVPWYGAWVRGGSGGAPTHAQPSLPVTIYPF